MQISCNTQLFCSFLATSKKIEVGKNPTKIVVDSGPLLFDL